MTEHVENQLLAMSAHLIKIQRSATIVSKYLIYEVIYVYYETVDC